MANLSFYASEIDDILGRADKATAATALTSTDTLAGLTDGLYTATAEVASAISDSPVSAAFTLRVLADMYILILADGSDTYTGAPGAWHKSSSGEDTTARAAIAEHIADKSNPHEVTKAQVGLGNVDNTADIDKPVSTAVSAALIDKVDKVSGKGLSTNDYTNTDKANLETALTKANAAAPQSTTYTKTEVDTALNSKQNALSSAQLVAVNSGIDSAKVEQIETNKSNISSVIKDIYLNDVYDSTALVSGKIIDYRDGREISSQYTTNYACTDYIPLSQGDFVKLAYVRGTDLCGGAVYDADKNFIKTIWGTDDWQRPSINLKTPFNFVANGNIAYLRYNVPQNSVYPRNKQYIKIIKAPILSGLTKELNVITVGTNGIFTTLKSCCDYIKDNNIIGAKVYVQAGTYDLVTEFGTDYLDNITSDANIGYGLYIGNNTHFVFAENAKVKFIYDGANSKAAEHFAPFNVYGSCILENANVEVTNARYCVHEDVPTTSIYPDEYTVKYINCVMRHNGATVSTGSHTGYACIGAGVNKNSLSIIDGGIYSGSWTADISYHNYNSRASSRLIVRNVYMTTGLRLQDFGSNTVDTEITGCYMPTLTGTYTKFNVKSWNNVNS